MICMIISLLVFFLFLCVCVICFKCNAVVNLSIIAHCYTGLKADLTFLCSYTGSDSF